MSIRGLIIALMLISAAGLAWQQQDRLRGWLASAPSVASVGQPSGGALRKCVKGQQVTYTDEATCPAGYKAQAVAGDVTVVPGTPVPKPAAASSGPSALHNALGVTRDETIKEKMMERAINESR